MGVFFCLHVAGESFDRYASAASGAKSRSTAVKASKQDRLDHVAALI